MWAFAILTAGHPTCVLAEEYQAYHVEHKDVHEVEKLVLDMFSRDQGVHVVADERGKRILVSGPDTVQRVVRELIESVDKPPLRRDETRVLRTYDCPQDSLQTLADRIRASFVRDVRVRVTVDKEASQLIVLAPPDIQETLQREFQRRFADRGDKSDTRPNPAAPRDDVPDAAARRSVQRFVPAQTLELSRLESMLADVFRGRLRRTGSPSSENVEYELRSASKQIVTLEIDFRSRGVRLSGPASAVDQLARLIAVLDRGGSSENVVRVVPLRRADPTALKQAIEAYRGSRPVKPPGASPVPVPANPAPAGGLKEGASPSGAESEEKSDGSSAITLTAQVQTSEPQGARPSDNEKAAGGGETNEPSGAEARRRLRQLGNDVQIESLDDLDTLILRGSPRDVEELTRIIKEIERLSALTVPVIDVIPLKYADSSVISEVVTKVNTDLVGSLRGHVTVSPLAKPNALLVIGWGDAVKSIRGLIVKLDQPVGPDAQFRAIRLKYASATAVSTEVQNFYAGRTGTGQRVTVVPDTRTNSVIIHGSPHDLDEAIALVSRLDAGGSASIDQARIIRLKNSLAADVAVTLQSAISAARGTPGAQKSSILELMTIDPRGEKILKSGVLNDVHVTADTHRNALIVQASPESMELLLALIRELDEAPATVGQIKVFRIVNGDATALIQMLRSLLPVQTGLTAAQQLPAGKGEPSLVPLRFAVELRTNSIIATGSGSELAIIEALLLRLDEKEARQRKTVVCRLKNSPANAVALAVNEFLRSQRQIQQLAPAQFNAFQQLESEVVVVPEPISNSLILSATPRFFDEVKQLVEKLDAQPPQVMIQVLIAQIELDNDDEFGIELGLQDSVLFDRSLLSNLITTTSSLSTPAGIVTSQAINTTGSSNTPGFNFNATPLPQLGNSGSAGSLGGAQNVGGQAVSNFGVSQASSQAGFSGLVLSAGSGNVSALLRALQMSQRMEILSRPQVRTLDNQPAYIQVGQRVPQIVSSTLTALGQINSVQLQNVGLILAVTPRISPDDTVVLEVDAEKSALDSVNPGIPISVSNNGTVIRSPIIDLTVAQTTVSAASGETIVLGGLITKSTSQTSRRVPWLADVPVLGSLFRYDSLYVTRTELLVIMTPYVIRTPQDAEAIKQKEVARMHWTCSDVHEIYGTGDLCKPGKCPTCDHEIPVIHPDLNPRGYVPDKKPGAEEIPEFEMPPAPAQRPGSPSDGPKLPTMEKEPVLFLAPRTDSDPFKEQIVRPVDFQIEEPADAAKQPGMTESARQQEPSPSARSRWANFWKPSTVPPADTSNNRIVDFPWWWGR